MSITLTVKDIMIEKATDFVFSKFTEVLNDKELKDKFTIVSQKYFDEIFENCDLSEEFDFEAVEKYLLDNFDNKIISIFHNIKNIGHEGRDSIREGLLRGAVARGNGNEKSIRKYCNSIIDFVGACLHDKISDNDKILASEITSVTNEYYKQLVNKIGDIEDIGREFLNKIEYFGSFAEQIDNIGLPRAITTSKFSYANPAIGFYGRNIEQEEIEKFMSDDRPLLFWSVTGRGGVGKSKFALHICKKYKQKNWKAAWLNKNTVEKINGAARNKGYNKPLLLVCDYAGEYVESIRTLLLNLLSNTQCKIRVLLLERSGYTPASDVDNFAYSDVWYNRLLSGHNSDDMKEIEYRTDSLNLDNYVLTDEDMFNILDDFSEKTLSEKSKKDIVNFTKNRLNSVSDKNNLSHSEERCLFLLFTADAFLNGNDYSHWDTNKLMDKYTERFKTNLEAHYSKNICKSAYTLLAVASAIGTIDIESVDTKSIFGYYISPIKDELSYNFDVNDLKMFLSALCEKDTADLNIYPMLPDLVGEFFFIDIFNKISPGHKREWYTIFCSERYQGYFCSFLKRCLYDWHSLKKFQNIIKDLFEFAKVNNYKGFIEECGNNSFFMGLSYHYTLTENDLLWIKDILLINKNERCYLEYTCIIVNVTFQMFNAEDILKAANQIKDEILSEYGTSEIAEKYALILVNAVAKMTNADEILKIVEQIKNELLSKYGTVEIALAYAMALFNLTTTMSNVDERLKIANQIKDEILSEYDTAEIAEKYAKTLVNATAKMTNADEILKIAEYIKNELLSKYDTTEIALRYAMVLVNSAAKMTNVDEILKIAEHIKDEILSKYGTIKIALRYAMVLTNAAAKMTNVDEILKIAEHIKDEILSEYGTAEIALVYSKALFNMTIKMTNANEILKIAKQIEDKLLSKYNTAEIAEQYMMIIVNAATKMTNADERLKIANQIKDEILSEYGTAEIALVYSKALFNMTIKMTNANERLKIAEEIKGKLLSKYDTAEIADQYAKTLVNVTAKMTNADEILKIAGQIKDELLSKYNTAKIALRYAIALVNATFEMSNADDRLKIANQIKDELLSKYGTAEIALWYVRVLANATVKMSNPDEILDISDRIKDILVKYNTKEIAGVYVVVLKFIYDNHLKHEYFLNEIYTVMSKYNMLLDIK